MSDINIWLGKAQSLEGDEDQPLKIDLLDKNKREKRRKNISG